MATGVSLFVIASFLTKAAPLSGSDLDDLRREFVTQRQGLLEFHSAGIAAYNGNRKAWTEAMRRVLAVDESNPYYRLDRR